MLQLKKPPTDMNPRQLHLKAGITYEAALQYMNKPETVSMVNLVTLSRIFKALDLDLSELRFLDVFQED